MPWLIELHPLANMRISTVQAGRLASSGLPFIVLSISICQRPCRSTPRVLISWLKTMKVVCDVASTRVPSDVPVMRSGRQ